MVPPPRVPRVTSPSRPLTPKQARFVAEYAVDLNATQAAIRAGYSANRAAATGSELLRDPLIRAEADKATLTVNRKVERKIAVRLEREAGSVAWIVEQAVRVVEESDNPRDRVPALALLAKRHPEFRDAPLVDNSQHVHLPEGLTVEELRALASGR